MYIPSWCTANRWRTMLALASSMSWRFQQVPALSLFELLAQDLAHLARRDRGLGTVHILR
jgi:hypothetical protein